MRRLASIPGVALILYFVWKVGLLLLTAQPVPVDDAFFLDGPVVNYLLHGQYCNPAIATVLPISGTEVFCGYPPLYQAVLFGWMKCFGPGGLAAMWLHVTLLAVIALTTLSILRRLEVPALALNFAGLFFFGITFHDRPDTLGQVFGLLAVLAVVRRQPWLSALFLLLTFATSLQTAGIYAVWVTAQALVEARFAQCRIPWTSMLTLAAVLAALVALVKFGFSHLWEGFFTHVAAAPSVTGWRLPAAGDFIKVVRNAPAALVVMAAVAGLATRGSSFTQSLAASPALRLVLSGCVAVAALMFVSLFVLSPGTMILVTYLQPVMVGGFLAVIRNADWPGLNWRRCLSGLLVAALLLSSVRAIAISTWGVMCARDIGRMEAIERINQELDAVPAGVSVFASGAYLYDIAPRTNITWLSASWAWPATNSDWKLTAIEHHRPARLFLTPLDYFGNYETAVAELQRTRTDVDVRITNLASVPSPEHFRFARRVVQYLSWAPVIVEFDWPKPVDPK